MSYFDSAFLKFFTDLSRNNTREWFNENRKAYEKEVKEPFSLLVEEMIARIRKYEPELQILPSESIMRINRDTRFSKDKTPYKTFVGANISVYGKKNKSYPTFAIQISHEGITVYGGIYMLDQPSLERVRSHIADNLKAFKEAYNDKSFKEKYGKIQGEQYKRLPTQWQEIAENELLISNKQFYYSASTNPDIITSDNLPEQLMEYYLAGKSVSDFLKAAYKQKDN